MVSCGTDEPEGPVLLNEGDNIVFVGNNLCSRMAYFGHFETALYQGYPEAKLTVRNMCDPGNTAGFRPHASRVSPWAFPGAENFNPAYAKNSDSQGFFPTEDQWLDSLDADVVIGFFGLSESYGGQQGLTNFALELDSFIRHTQQQRYNGETAPQLVLVSPLAYENSAELGLPDGTTENENLELYTQAMRDMAADNGVLFVDLYTPSLEWMQDDRLTTDGISLTDEGYARLGDYLAEQIFGIDPVEEDEELLAAVNHKNYFWLLDFKMPNGVHVYGRRFKPYGPDNYPYEITKVRQMTRNRDAAIWAHLAGEDFDVARADEETIPLPPVETNYAVEAPEDVEYLYGEELMSTFTVAPGYQLELFASEEDFPLLANPAQMNWDNQGRLWVSVMPSYPHYKPGDALPNDKLVILEDTDKDGKADNLKVWADSLHLPVGFEFAEGGVYVSQGTNLVFLKDTDGDDEADYREIVLSGFDDHDTHHNISAYEADPAGGIYMGEGIFLHTNVETPHGPVRATNGGFYRFEPKRRHLERTAQIAIPNPWGIIFDEWGQPIFAHTSDPNVRWMLPSTMKNVYAVQSPMADNIIEGDHMVRPTSGLEIVSSRHFPDEVQGDLLINNTIGFLGMKQHRLYDTPDGGFATKWRQDLFTSTDGNFRPVDMEFAPDGSLYVVDWHNVLVGHMQHNARDPLRDHVHGRVYRITYPGRPLVEEPKVAGATIPELLDNLKLPEYRTRYRTRRVLREHDADEVMEATRAWVASLDENDPNYEKYLREALFVSWGANQLDTEILDLATAAEDYRLRAAAARVVRYMGHQLDDEQERLLAFAEDDNPRVRMEAAVAATWLDQSEAEEVLAVVEQQPADPFAKTVMLNAKAQVDGQAYVEPVGSIGEDPDSPIAKAYALGGELYAQEGYCQTCHQKDGKGLGATGYPPLAGSDWVTGDPERLIKLVMYGLYGPLEINGKKYNGQVPMTAYGGLMSNEEMAAVLTYVRNSFGNEASMIKPEEVGTVRTSTAGRKDMYSTEELLKEHPLEVK